MQGESLAIMMQMCKREKHAIKFKIKSLAELMNDNSYGRFE